MTERPAGPAGQHTSTYGRTVVLLAILVLALASFPVASAHGGQRVPVPQWVGMVPLLVGIGVVGASVALHRTRWTDRSAAGLALAFVGLTVAAFGAVALVQLSPVDAVNVSQSPVDRSLFHPLAALVGLSIVLLSVLVGRLYWPDRPRNSALGVLLGLWVAYPGVMAGHRPLLNPLGAVVVLAVPVAVGYVLYRDCAGALRVVFADRAARWFAVGVGVLGTLFFAFSNGMLTVVPDQGLGLPWTHPLVAVLPVADPLVYWPAVEFWFPSAPLGGYLSVGTVVLVGLLGVLVALNAAVVAYQWRCRDPSNVAQGVAGSAALAAPNACCCCGPVLSQLAVVAVGPAAAAPFYWLFVDFASPVGALFFVASVALLAGNVVRFARALTGRPR